MKALKSIQSISPLTRFLLLGSVLELLLLLLCSLFTFNATNPISSPSSTDWFWIIGPSQPLVFKTWVSSLKFSDPGIHFILLSLIIIALSSIYLYTVGYAFHISNNIFITSRWLLLTVIVATTFGLTSLFLPTLFNYEGNSYIFKSLALLSHLINCVLIWIILTFLTPARRMVGTILYAWNPLALIELAGHGHNEGFLIFFLLLTILFIIQQKGRWFDFWAMVFLGCAMSMNGIALLFAPMIIYFSILRTTIQAASKTPIPDGEQRTTITLTTRSWSGMYLQVVWGCVWRTLVAVITASVLYFLFWKRISTFTSIFSPFDMQYLIHSPLSILVIPVQLLNSFLFRILYPPAALSTHYLQAIPAANMAVQASAMFIFILMYIYLLSKVRSIDTLFTSLCLTGLGFLILLSAQFWPWFILWVLWIIALRRFDALTLSVLLLSCTALLMYPFLYIDNLPIVIYQPLLIFGIPLIYLITRLKRSNERMTFFYDRRSETAKN
jgi:hypothetical protein